MLPTGMTIEEASAGFRNQGQFIAALNVSKNQNIDFVQLKDAMTVDGLSLGQAAKQVRTAPAPAPAPDATATGSTTTVSVSVHRLDDGEWINHDDVWHDNRSGREVRGGSREISFPPLSDRPVHLRRTRASRTGRSTGKRAPESAARVFTNDNDADITVGVVVSHHSTTTSTTSAAVPISTYRQFGAWLDDASAAGSGEGYTSIGVGHWRMLGSTQTNLPMLGVGVGVTDRMQVGASVPFYRASYEGGSASGMDDVYLSAKYTLVDPTLTSERVRPRHQSDDGGAERGEPGRSGAFRRSRQRGTATAAVPCLWLGGALYPRVVLFRRGPRMEFSWRNGPDGIAHAVLLAERRCRPRLDGHRPSTDGRVARRRLSAWERWPRRSSTLGAA